MKYESVLWIMKRIFFQCENGWVHFIFSKCGNEDMYYLVSKSCLLEKLPEHV